jgi:trehalose 6-phosphate synthase
VTGTTPPTETGSPADFVVVANRLPIDLVWTENGRHSWTASPGGLVSALEPFLRSRHGAWVGWPGVPDVEVEAFDDDGLVLHPVALTADEVRDYYEGFSNATLWPLYHDVVERPVFDRAWWNSYVGVNRRFAEATAKVAAPGATVWVQDYQLQLVPAMLRELRPDLRIGFFLHIPFPPVELFMQMPWRAAIIRGLAGADLVGFQRPGGAQNFLWLSRRLIGLESTRGAVGVRSRPGTLQVGDRTVRVGAFPISIDANAHDELGRSKGVADRAAELRRDLGDPKTVLLGVDRLDYTKGIDLRLQALRELLQEGRLQPDEVIFVQLATPSRERVEHYQRMRGEIEQTVSRINGEFARVGRPVVHYLHQSVDRTELAALYAMADVMVVTPLRDGMNLVSKEYVAARNDLSGALVLSEFAGAAAELTSAFLVNPHDLDGVKDALMEAVRLEPAEGRRRMRAMRRQVLTHDIDRWAHSFLNELGAEPED